MERKKEFERELRDSLYIHKPLPLHRERALEAGYAAKPVLESRPVWQAGVREAAFEGGERGRAFVHEAEGARVIRMQAPLRRDAWPEGTPPYGDYCNFGEGVVRFPLEDESWSSFNRLRFWVKPMVRGARVVHLNVNIVNEGAVKVPDEYFREGATVFDLVNHEWNECFWEFPSLPRDRVTALRFYVFLSGQDVPVAPEAVYEYRDILLERVASPEKEKGWQPAAGRIALSSLGYLPVGEKTAIAPPDVPDFSVINTATGEAVLQKDARPVANGLGCFSVLDFSGLSTPGVYTLQAGGLQSEPFRIEADLLTEPVWKAVNFFYAERCGTHVPGKHGTCHMDVVAEHGGVLLPFCGGWHDAGDLSQQAAQSAEITHALLEAMEATSDPLLKQRLSEEAQWGLDFILRTRFGDGYRATSAGLTRWTNNRIGDMDDVPVRVHNHAYENFLFSGVEAYAASALARTEPDVAAGCLDAAIADYAFAAAEFAKTGVQPAHMYEHTYNSGRSQYYAVACWAASLLHRATGDEAYARAAREWAEKLLACQETRGGMGMKGFFYRDETHGQIVHFNHQSREYQFVQALAAVLEGQPGHPDADRWRQGIALYGAYLKALKPYTEPYGMLAAGIHRLDEPEDRETFEVLHITVDHEAEKQNYRDQLAAGERLDEHHVIKRFPVWFSFRGNAAVHLAAGKAAAIAGRVLADDALLGLGREQLYWIFGKNPFGQSLMYGVGSSYCTQYSVMLGETVGAVPVGIETYGNEDEPYWPGNNNATYREVWVGSVCRWLWLANEFLL